MSNILTFDDLTTNNKALKKFVQAFTRAGAPVATIDTDGKPKRTTGVTYRELVLTFVDNQKAVFLIKQGGSIFQVKINGALVPIKNQDDQVKAVGEIVQILDSGRAKFQAKLARQKVALPSGLKTAAPRLEVKLQEASTKLANDIATAQARVAELKSELGERVMDSTGGEENVLDAVKLSVKAEVREGYLQSKAVAFVAWKEVAHGTAIVEASAADRREFGYGTFRVAKGGLKNESIVKIDPKGMKLYFVDNDHYENTDEVKWDQDYAKLTKLIISDMAKFSEAYQGGVILDSVAQEDPNDGTEFNLELALAQAKAIIAGEVMDDSHAVANLKISLDVVETNYPIHLAEGKLDQAELEQAAAVSFKEAIAILEQKEDVLDGVKFNPKTDRWVTTEAGGKLMIRGDEVVAGAGGKLNGSKAAKPKIKFEAIDDKLRSFAKSNLSSSYSIKDATAYKNEAVKALTKAGLSDLEAKLVMVGADKQKHKSLYKANYYGEAHIGPDDIIFALKERGHDVDTNWTGSDGKTYLRNNK